MRMVEKVGEFPNMEECTKAAASLNVLPTEEYFSRVRQEMARKGWAYVRVTGMSMWPILHHLRDGVIIVPPEKIRMGDIVLFDRQNGRYALHRVVGKGKTGFTMAGDHQWHMEKHLPYEQIVGVVSTLNRKGRLIPANNFFNKIYAWCVILLTVPRIYLRRVISAALKPLRRAAPDKGASS